MSVYRMARVRSGTFDRGSLIPGSVLEVGNDWLLEMTFRLLREIYSEYLHLELNLRRGLECSRKIVEARPGILQTCVAAVAVTAGTSAAGCCGGWVSQDLLRWCCLLRVDCAVFPWGATVFCVASSNVTVSVSPRLRQTFPDEKPDP